MLIALNKRSGDFDSVDLKLVKSIGAQTAVFLEYTRLYADMKDLLMGVLHALTASIDAKDPYTCGHSHRVAAISRRLAEAAGLPAEKVQRIYLAGLLHDIGKIGVPESVLRKPGKLTAEECKLVKDHPAIGARILGGIRQFDDVRGGHLDAPRAPGRPGLSAGPGRRGGADRGPDHLPGRLPRRDDLRPNVPSRPVAGGRCGGDPARRRARRWTRLGRDAAVDGPGGVLAESGGRGRRPRPPVTVAADGSCDMNITAESYGHAVILNLKGDLTEDSLRAFMQVVDHHLGDNHVVDVVLNMEQVPFIDSAGLECLLDLQDRLTQKFGQVKLVGCDENVRKILEITRQTPGFEILNDVAEAVKAIRV